MVQGSGEGASGPQAAFPAGPPGLM
jgi:hypothetical protein